VTARLPIGDISNATVTYPLIPWSAPVARWSIRPGSNRHLGGGFARSTSLVSRISTNRLP